MPRDLGKDYVTTPIVGQSGRGVKRRVRRARRALKGSSIKARNKKNKRIREYWDLNSSDISDCDDEEACEGGGNGILAYVLLIGVGLCVCFCGIYFLIVCLKKAAQAEQDELKNKRV